MSLKSATDDIVMAEHVVECDLDGTTRCCRVTARETLAQVLNRTGVAVNLGCNQGWCGSCLVEMDGVPTRSCLVLATQCTGSTIRTGRTRDAETSRVHEWMVACSAVQCGYCTPAFVTRITDLARQAPTGLDRETVRRAFGDVFCRCTGYQGLVDAGVGVLSGRPAPEHLARREDERLLTRSGRYVGGLNLPGQVWARVVRSTRPHADILDIDIAEARTLPGVFAVFVASDLPETMTRLHDDLPGPPEPALAADEVRYIGQPVAVVIAETAETARDAADLVSVHYRDRPILSGPDERDCLPPEYDPRWLPPLTQHAGEPTGDPHVVVEKTFTIARQTGMPIETRGLLAHWNGDIGVLTVHGVTKHPELNRQSVAGALGLSVDQVSMPATDIGGSFGVKGELYPEDLLVPWASKRLGRPVKWIEDRAEHVVAVNHSRGQVWHVRMAADENGRLLDARVRIEADAGAYVRPLCTLVPYLASAMFPGPYRLPAYSAEVRCLQTSRTPIGTVRAPGRVEANFVRERMLDMLAEQLGMDAVTVRRRNLLTADEMPYDAGTMNEGPVHYDTGDFLGAFEDAVTMAGPVSTGNDGLRRGAAVVPFVEKAGLGGPETAVITLRPDDGVRLDVASAPSGQSHETTLCAIAAEILGVPSELITVVFGDPASGARGPGTFASRTITHTGNAVRRAACLLRDELIERAPDGWALDWPVIRDRDGRQVTSVDRLLAASGTAITACGEYDTDRHTYPYGAVTCAVAVDPELFTVRVERLAITCDAGRPINRNVVVGQLMGGLVQGVGSALLEEIRYDDTGCPMTTGFDNYLLPHADDVPDIEVHLIEPAPPSAISADNPLGAKGIGEAGIAAVPAAVASAVCAAVPELNRHVTELPLDPTRLWSARAAGTDRTRTGKDMD